MILIGSLETEMCEGLMRMIPPLGRRGHSCTFFRLFRPSEREGSKSCLILVTVGVAGYILPILWDWPFHDFPKRKGFRHGLIFTSGFSRTDRS